MHVPRFTRLNNSSPNTGLRAQAIAGLVLLWVQPSAYAEKCADVYMRRGHVGTIVTSPAEHTTLELPKPYRHFRITNPEVWYIDEAKYGTPDNVLVVSPKLPGLAEKAAVVQFNGQAPVESGNMVYLDQLLKRYKSSTLSVWAMDNSLYSFRVQVADRHPACYTVVDFDADRRSVDTERSSRAVAAEQVATAQARDAVQQFIEKAYAHYTWSEPQGWFGSPIKKIIDDGRFTYVTVKDPSKGAMAVLARIDEILSPVQHEYNATTGTYKIWGTYPSLVFKHGTSELTVTRGTGE